MVSPAVFNAADRAGLAQTDWQCLTLRSTERGQVQAEFARFPVWTVSRTGTSRQETLFLKRESQGIRYPLTKAPPATDLATLALRKGQRYFIERSLQEAKSELGRADFQALKDRA